MRLSFRNSLGFDSDQCRSSLEHQVAMGAVGRINNQEIMVTTTSLFLAAKDQITLLFKNSWSLVMNLSAVEGAQFGFCRGRFNGS